MARGTAQDGVDADSISRGVADVFGPHFISARQLLRDFPDMRPPIIHGLLRRGEVMNVIAPQKTGKSWLALDAAFAVATGRAWLGYGTERGEVLIVDNELHPETLARRIPRVAEARGIVLPDVVDRLQVECFRGKLRDILQLQTYFTSIPAGRFAVIVLDALYRCLPGDAAENDNVGVAQVYNAIDRYAAATGAAFMLIHHTTKGNQSSRAVTDVGAGAGAQSRAADTHLILRAHEEMGAFVLDAAVRSWPPIAPTCLRWQFPAFELAPDLDPLCLRPERPRRQRTAKTAVPAAERRSAKPPWTAARFAAEIVGAEVRTEAEILERASAAGLGERRAKALLSRAREMHLLARARKRAEKT